MVIRAIPSTIDKEPTADVKQRKLDLF